jgi:hypothetical protein
MTRAILLALILTGCTAARDYVAIPTPTGKAACGVITIHKADGTRETHGEACR